MLYFSFGWDGFCLFVCFTIGFNYNDNNLPSFLLPLRVWISGIVFFSVLSLSEGIKVFISSKSSAQFLHNIHLVGVSLGCQAAETS